MPDPAPTAAPAQRLSGQTRLAIGLLLVSSFVVILNETIISVAIPVIMTDMGLSAATGQWLATAFMLTMAIVIPVTGYLLQRFQTRPIFMAAMGLFSLGTLLAGLAPTFAILVAARVIQASGTAVMLPLLMTTLMTLVPPAARGRTMGNVSIVMAVAPAIGPAVSGLVMSVLPWRWIFFLVVPIAVLALVLGILRVPNVGDPRRLPLDVISVVLAALAFGGLIYGLSSLGQAAQGDALLPWWPPVLVGTIALVAFVARQLRNQRIGRALLDLRVFASHSFTMSVAMMLGLMLSLFGAIILLPIYLSDARDLDPLVIGLSLLPGGVCMGILGPLAGRIYDRRGPRILLVPGSLIVVTALAGMALTLTAHSSALVVVGWHVWLSLGLGLLFTPLFTSALGALPAHLYSHGSAVVGTVQQLAAAAGTALFIVVLTVAQLAASSAGAGTAEAVAEGTRAAFGWGAGMALLIVVAALFVRRQPVSAAAGAPAPTAEHTVTR
ncbi:MAG TPA: MDR family MFS transporter [Actinomycetaceae bacterium]|nr:MDR family MFS transporter [Actinomycetaceae bacterium]